MTLIVYSLNDCDILWPHWGCIEENGDRKWLDQIHVMGLMERKHQWIGLGENLQENPTFNGKNHGPPYE